MDIDICPLTDARSPFVLFNMARTMTSRGYEAIMAYLFCLRQEYNACDIVVLPVRGGRSYSTHRSARLKSELSHSNAVNFAALLFVLL